MRASEIASSGPAESEFWTPDESSAFVRQVHEIVRDLLVPRAAIFWSDFLVTIAIAYGSGAAYMTAKDWMFQQGVYLIVPALAVYRLAVFIHEIAHRPAGTFRAFTFMWNVLCGIPLFMPSFLYGDHKSHHSNQSYGTSSDAEY